MKKIVANAPNGKRGSTKRKRPIISPDVNADGIYGFLAGKGRIAGNIVAPTLSRKEWRSLSNRSRRG